MALLTEILILIYWNWHSTAVVVFIYSTKHMPFYCINHCTQYICIIMGHSDVKVSHMSRNGEDVYHMLKTESDYATCRPFKS
jgi:hypothetical protein